ncbi:MAG: PhoH family protein [Neisseriaceae bacterium]
MSLIVHHQLTELDNQSLQRLCGALDEHIKTLAQALQISISRRFAAFTFSGEQAGSGVAALNELVEIAQNRELTLADIQMAVIDAKSNTQADAKQQSVGVYHLKTKKGYLNGRTPRQNQYIKALLSHDVVFGVGPAGTGKTYIAVAAAVDAMERQLVERIVLVRPAVEAGEKLGFLPGDLSQKVDPYLRPLYDALYELMGFDKVMRLLEKGLIEIAPLAYMRGRTLNGAYVILDEAQNTTPEQMKMFLTRIGFGAKAVITGDSSQVDLPKHIKSGLRDAEQKLQGIDGLHFHYFKSDDVVRHPLVQKIVEAYEAHDDAQVR